jgi:pyruvate/2-oxoglutarate dehydrogenase complex dihydrolipoamide acyltransferase (E2) component
MMDYKILPFPSEREIVVDFGRLASRRHIYYGLLEVDVTLARQRLRDLSAQTGLHLSFTAFIVACLARAIEANPLVQACFDWRRRLVVFQDVDVVTLIEPEPGAVAIPHIIRSANHRTVRQISDEIRAVRARPEASPQRSRLVALAPRLPAFVRRFFYWLIKIDPHRFKRMSGTVVVTSVGMFGKGGGWGISFLPYHSLGLTVGGISQKPGVHAGAIEIREFLDLTLSFDHDIVDGAPAARFASSFRQLLESAGLLDDAEL